MACKYVVVEKGILANAMLARNGTAAKPQRIGFATLDRRLQAGGSRGFSNNMLVVGIEERDERPIGACLVHSGLSKRGEDGVAAGCKFRTCRRIAALTYIACGLKR